MKKDEKQSILAARVPDALVRKLDRAAKANGRTRSSELRMRLEQSLAGSAKQLKVAA